MIETIYGEVPDWANVNYYRAYNVLNGQYGIYYADDDESDEGFGGSYANGDGFGHGDSQDTYGLVDGNGDGTSDNDEGDATELAPLMRLAFQVLE